MPSASEMERLEQESHEEMQRVSGTLNRDAFACVLIERQIEEQEEASRAALKEIAHLEARLEVERAKRTTAQERIASLRDTLSRLEKPRG